MDYISSPGTDNSLKTTYQYTVARYQAWGPKDSGVSSWTALKMSCKVLMVNGRGERKSLMEDTKELRYND